MKLRYHAHHDPGNPSTYLDRRLCFGPESSSARGVDRFEPGGECPLLQPLSLRSSNDLCQERQLVRGVATMCLPSFWVIFDAAHALLVATWTQQLTAREMAVSCQC
eukprot:COSAG01_NODE_41763_length_447_cov_2.206897_1_plen_105_part_01